MKTLPFCRSSLPLLVGLCCLPMKGALAQKGGETPKLICITANSSVMNLELRHDRQGYLLSDKVKDEQFLGQRPAYYINGQFYGHKLNLHALPGTRMSIMKLVLPPDENPTDFWRIKPSAKANALVTISSSKPALSGKAKSTRNFLPSWYEDTTEYRPTKYAPKFKLIEDKVNASYLKRNDVTWQNAIGRAGLTQVEAEHVPVDALFAPGQASRYGLPSTHVFDAFGKKEGKDLTRDEVRSVAGGFGPFGLLGDQFGEGETWFPSDSDQAYWFYERAREIAADPKCTWKPVFFGTYGGFTFYNVRSWGGPGQNLAANEQEFSKFYVSPELAGQSCSYFDRMARVIDANVSWYAQDFSYANNLYQRIHSIQVLKMGQALKAPDKKTYLFWWNGIENGDNGPIHNGYLWEHQTTNPPGKSLSPEHPVVDLNSAIGMCLIAGFVVGDGVIGWDNNIQFASDPNLVGRDQEWTPAGDDKNVHRAEQYGYPGSPVNIMSAQFIASQWYQSCGRTTGSQWKYARYKVDDGPWVEPEANGSTILKLAKETNPNFKGIAFARQKGKAVDWVFQNPTWLPDQQHKVTLDVGGHQWSQVVRSNEVVLCNETIGT